MKINIKSFRAWYKPDFKTKDGPIKFILEKNDSEGIYFYAEIDRDIRYNFEIPFVDEDWIVEQFTGFQDRDGVDVYEGDIVEYVEGVELGDKYREVGIVKYEDYFGSFGFASFSEKDCKNFKWEGVVDHIKVLGNIYRNPELLK